MKNRPYYIPATARRVKIVETFNELVTTPFSPDCNLIVQPDEVQGDGEGLALIFWQRHSFEPLEYTIEPLKEVFSEIRGEAAKTAAQIMKDMKALYKALSNVATARLPPGLRYIPPTGYNIDEKSVHAFHKDGGGNKKGRITCCYAGTSTEWAPNNEDMSRSTVIPFGQSGEPGTQTYRLKDETIRPFSLPLGMKLKHAVTRNGLTPATIHRAPKPDGRPRLLLVG